ncbi:glucose-1-phosphate adenylyltransferase [Actinokineospora alba]|uniref:Glucose-1-phosphate adenylyltransferase n=1 Tax=Actinokineospora alba TaxID=504798 RepID=A0A1H0RM74_9PSEU|nr:glucose-1-phosphate adenylyltransferase [Actinokineospora alba]TDP67017.1 glucose-1-phosphate adenylyltransferase [Actinokineospora alba]SDJ31595.1 glucose-1-phosphate adenylyltransferase [Actinokineospora alba]SDP30429.1 glucose-1-phosphate adenylyltransferase [Actinokineospora alba]
MKGRPRVLGIVLAGGEGKRLWPLTADRAKPAVPFGGNYRLVDFVLSNLVNGGFHQLCVLTQYKSHSLDRHISTTWRLSSVLGQYITPVPAQQRLGPRWYTGSADAIFQSLNLVYDEAPDHIAVFGADHVYRMDPEQMLDRHMDSGAGVTVAGIRVPRAEARAFGCIDSGADGRITRFLEKPADPPSVPDDPNVTFASMGNYLFKTSALLDALRADAANPDSLHDMGGDIIPMLVDAGTAHVYDFDDNDVPGATERDRGYWRDVGTLDAYYEAHQDLVSVHPVFNLYNQRWPIRTATPPLPPAKFVNLGSAVESIVGPGAIISGASVVDSVISADVVIEDGAVVEGSVLLPGVRVGKGATVRRAILDKNVIVADGARIGVDQEADRQQYTVSANGVVVLGKGVRAE